MGGANAQQQMHMIGHSTNGFGYNLQSFRRAAKVGVKPWTPYRLYQWLLVLRPENDVDMQTQMG